MTEHRTRDEYAAMVKAAAYDRCTAAIRRCEAAGTVSRAEFAEACGVRTESAVIWLRENESALPPELAALPWVQTLIAPYVRPKKPKAPKAKKRRAKFPVAGVNAKVKTGWKAEVVAARSRPPKVGVSLKPLPAGIVIEGAEKWGKVSHAGE
jgi:hypothetical protein